MDAKGSVERPVPYARDSFFAGRSGEFVDLAAMQADALRWSRDVANQRPCRPLARVAPQVVFDAEEADALLPLPRVPFELASWSTPKVGPDIHLLTELTQEKFLVIPFFRLMAC